MIIILFKKTREYFQEKVRIDKAVNQKTAYKIQLYNDWQVDELVKKNSEGEVNSKPAPSQLWADLAVLNKPEVYKNYNKIINSKYTSEDNIDKIIIKNKANKDLNRIVEAEVERISKNLDYVEQVVQKYEVPFQMYEDIKAEQKKNSIANRQEVLKQTAVKANDLLVSDGLNINHNVFTYKNIEKTAEHLLRQSQMGSKHEEINAINQHYVNQGKDKIYTGKEWIWTGRGKTTRHRSSHLQKRQLNEPFVIINDKTLHIDELMYPSDPAGSFSNAFICYCECQYLTGDDADLKQLGSLSLTDNTFKVNTNALKPTPTFMNAKQFKDNLKKPKPVKIAQPASSNVEGYMNVNVATPVASYIDDSVDGVISVPHNYVIDGSKVEIVYSDGKYYYHGLELKDYDVVDMKGKVSKSAVTKHNNNINSTVNDTPAQAVINEPVKEFIGKEDVLLYSETNEEYTISIYKADKINGKYYYNGLDITDYMHSGGKWFDVPESVINAHNNKVTGEPATQTENINPIKEEITDIDLQEGFYSASHDEYTIYDFMGVNEVDGKYYYKGLDITDYWNSEKDWADVPADVINAHNAEINGVNVDEISDNKKPFDTEHLVFDGENYQFDKYDGLEYNEDTGKWEVNGLEVDSIENADGSYPLGYISGKKIKDHNDELGYDGGNIEIQINDTDIAPQTESDFKPVVTVKDYVLPRSNGKISKAIKYGKDEDGQRYAVDKNGRQWVIDEGNHSKFEKLQDAIQKLIDFTTAEFNGVSNWGHSGYRPINKFLFQKDDYNKGFKHILDEVIPVLNKIRKEQAETGNISQSLLNSFDNILNKVNDSKMVQTLTWIKDIDVAMAKAPPLPQDTLLGRAGAWDLNFNKVGEIFEWEGYSGTAYDPAGLDLGHGSVKYNITILAPKGTRGVYLSEDTFDSYGEREWLLPRGQKFKVLEFDEEAHTCTIELINEWD